MSVLVFIPVSFFGSVVFFASMSDRVKRQYSAAFFIFAIYPVLWHEASLNSVSLTRTAASSGRSQRFRSTFINFNVSSAYLVGANSSLRRRRFQSIGGSNRRVSVSYQSTVGIYQPQSFVGLLRQR